MNIRQTPGYHEGFFDALDAPKDAPIFDATPGYRAGWEAAMRSREIFRNAGFEDKGREFTVSTTIPSPDRGDET